MRQLFFKIFIFFGAINLYPVSFSQVNNSFSELIADYIDSDRGLPQNQVLDIIDDEKGLIIATTNGIFRFDGTHFFRFIANNEYAQMIYRKIFLNRESGELYAWGGNNYYAIDPEYKKLATIKSVIEDKDTMIGLKENGMIIRFLFKPENTIDSFRLDLNYALNIARSGHYYYVSDSTALYQIDWRTKKIELLRKGVFDILAVNPYNKELVALESYTGTICLLNGGETRVYSAGSLYSRLYGFTFYTVAFFSASDILISGVTGLYHLKDGELKFYNSDNSQVKTLIMKILYLERENILLMGTENKGLLKLTPNNIRTFYIDDRGTNSFTGVTADDRGVVYSSVTQGNYIKIKNDELVYKSKIPAHVATLNFINGKMYAGTWGDGVQIYEREELVGRITYPDIPSRIVRGIFEDSEKNIWFGTERGVIKWAKGVFTRVLPEISDSFFSFMELRNGDICVGGGGFIYILNKDGKLLKSFTKKNGLVGREVRSFFEDEKNRIWVGTYGGGVFVIDGDKIVSINLMPNCMLYEDAFTLADYKDVLYMSSNKGIWTVPKQSLYDFYEGKLSYLIPGYLGKEIGLQQKEFNGGFGNNYLINNDRIYFPSISGFVEYFPQEHQVKNRTFIPFLRSVLINDTLEIRGDFENMEMAFERNTHSIRFDFYSVSYLERFNLHYQYKVIGKGLSEDWSRPQKSNFVNLKLLPPGEYTFVVRGIGSDNSISPEEMSFSFSIKPYFYETKLFYTLIFLFLVGLLFFFIRKRVAYLNEQSKMNHTILELKLNAIQSKLDPHFIFNSLNNVIYLLNIEKYEEAEELLQDFSLLLRQYIEKNDDVFTPIYMEMQVIELYLSIQQKRYNYSFQYEINYPEEIGKLEIPTMIIQPFVENAILHGLAHIVSKGKLLIDIRKTPGDVIEIKIEDNGIGRRRSAEINKERKNHASRGISLIHEKSRVLKEKYGLVFSTKIIDIEDEFRTGTIVIIKITPRKQSNRKAR